MDLTPDGMANCDLPPPQPHPASPPLIDAPVGVREEQTQSQVTVMHGDSNGKVVDKLMKIINGKRVIDTGEGITGITNVRKTSVG